MTALTNCTHRPSTHPGLSTALHTCGDLYLHQVSTSYIVSYLYLHSQCSLFVAVIVDNLARAQAAANYSRKRDDSMEQVRQSMPAPP